MAELRKTREAEYLACKARLADLFSQIDAQFDALWDENNSLRARLGMDPGQQREQFKPIAAAAAAAGAAVTDSQTKSKFKLKKLSRGNDKKAKEEDKWANSRTFLGHRDGVWETTSCPWDPSLFASASVDRTARLWSAETGLCSFAYFGHKGSVNSVRLRADSRLLLTASGDRTVHISRVPTAPTATAAAELYATRRAAKGGAPLSPLTAGQPLPADAMHNLDDLEPLDPTQPAPQAQPQNTVFVRAPVQEMKGHTGVVIAADFVGSDKVVSASWDKTVRLWSVNGAEIVQIPIGGTERMHLTNVVAHPLVPSVICSASDGAFRVWDTRTSPSQHYGVDTVVAHDSCLTAVFSSDGANIVSSGLDRLLKVWDVRQLRSPKEAMKCATPLGRLWLSPLNQFVVVPQDSSCAHVFDLSGHRRGKMKAERSENAPFTCASWASNESVVHTGNFEGKITAWRAAW